MFYSRPFIGTSSILCGAGGLPAGNKQAGACLQEQTPAHFLYGIEGNYYKPFLINTRLIPQRETLVDFLASLLISFS